MKKVLLLSAFTAAVLLPSCIKEEENSRKTIEWVVKNETDTTIVVLSSAEMNATARSSMVTYTDSIASGDQAILRSYFGGPYNSIHGLFREIRIYKNDVMNTVSVFADHRWSRTQFEDKEVNLIQIDNGFFE
jgi:hypothetical protein